jgi:hypothetical protein
MKFANSMMEFASPNLLVASLAIGFRLNVIATTYADVSTLCTKVSFEETASVCGLPKLINFD